MPLDPPHCIPGHFGDNGTCTRSEGEYPRVKVADDINYEVHTGSGCNDSFSRYFLAHDSDLSTCTRGYMDQLFTNRVKWDCIGTEGEAQMSFWIDPDCTIPSLTMGKFVLGADDYANFRNGICANSKDGMYSFMPDGLASALPSCSQDVKNLKTRQDVLW